MRSYEYPNWSMIDDVFLRLWCHRTAYHWVYTAIFRTCSLCSLKGCRWFFFLDDRISNDLMVYKRLQNPWIHVVFWCLLQVQPSQARSLPSTVLRSKGPAQFSWRVVKLSEAARFSRTWWSQTFRLTSFILFLKGRFQKNESAVGYTDCILCNQERENTAALEECSLGCLSMPLCCCFND